MQLGSRCEYMQAPACTHSICICMWAHEFVCIRIPPLLRTLGCMCVVEGQTARPTACLCTLTCSIVSCVVASPPLHSLGPDSLLLTPRPMNVCSLLVPILLAGGSSMWLRCSLPGRVFVLELLEDALGQRAAALAALPPLTAALRNTVRAWQGLGERWSCIDTWHFSHALVSVKQKNTSMLSRAMCAQNSCPGVWVLRCCAVCHLLLCHAGVSLP